MVPDTCVPTWTVSSGCSVPVASTVATMSPRDTASNVSWVGAADTSTRT